MKQMARQPDTRPLFDRISNSVWNSISLGGIVLATLILVYLVQR